VSGSGGVDQGEIIAAFPGLIEGMLRPGERVKLTVELREAEMAEREVLKAVLTPRLKEILDASKSKARRKMQLEAVRDIQNTQTMIKVFHELRQFVDMWSHDQREDAPIRSGRVLVEKIGNDDDEVKLLIWRGINEIVTQFNVPMLLLNVEYEKEIVEAFIPQIESPVIVEMALPERHSVTEVSGAPTSATKIGNVKRLLGESDEEFRVRRPEVEKYRHEVLAFIVEKWREAGSPNTVIFCQLAFEHWLRGKLPEGIRVGHYGATTGTNQYEDADLMFLVGRALPMPKIVESIACTISALQVESVVGKNPKRFYWYPPETAEIMMRDGRSFSGRGWTHPDPLCRALVRSILSELLQAFGRLRLWGREGPAKVFLMLDEAVPSAVVTDVEYWPEPAEPGAFDALIAGGIVLMSGVDLMRLHASIITAMAGVEAEQELAKWADIMKEAT
jgi:hypothetical protein